MPKDGEFNFQVNETEILCLGAWLANKLRQINMMKSYVLNSERHDFY